MAAKLSKRTGPGPLGLLADAALAAAVMLALAAPLFGADAPKKAQPGASDGAKAEEAQPQQRTVPLSSRSMAHLYTQMQAEPALAPIDLEHYVSHLPQILSLKEHPENTPPLLEATGWTENRMVYVAVKVGAGLMGMLDPDNHELKRCPVFVKPTPEELELILQMEPEIAKAYMAASRAEAQKPAGRAQRNAPR